MERKYKRTLYACYLAYINQAIVVNLAPLLFVTFQEAYRLSVSQIGLLVTFNFTVQIVTDLLAARFVDRIGPKVCIVVAQILAAVGLVGLAVLPDRLPWPYLGLMLCTAVYAVGGGLMEVLISPIVEALPTQGKSAAMSLLHSFYSWGQALVVLLSTVYFRIAGGDNWRFLPILWALLPIVNIVQFLGAPVSLPNRDGEAISVRKLFSMKIFWLFVLVLICSGASEHAMGQWASYFAEHGLKVSKTAGDLLGPMTFAVLMAVSRTFYGIKGSKISLERFLVFSGVLCIASYLIAIFSPIPVLSLVGCGLCGLSVGIMWPGAFSLAAKHCIQGGTAMFAYLALAGDIGCASGPSVVSTVTELCGGRMEMGLLAATVFPILLVVCALRLKKK